MYTWKCHMLWDVDRKSHWNVTMTLKMTRYTPWNGIKDGVNSIVIRQMKSLPLKYSKYQVYEWMWVNKRFKLWTATTATTDRESSLSVINAILSETFLQRFSSNETQLVLESASMATTGKYSCEVSADAPSFHTLIAAAELEVVGK